MPRFVAILISAFLPALAAPLSNGRITANFNNRGLTSLTDTTTHFTRRFPKDEFAITLGGQSFGARTTTGLLADPSRTVALKPRAGDYVVQMPAASAALLTLPPS